MKTLTIEVEEVISEFVRTRGQPALTAIQTKHDCGTSRGLPLLIAVARELTFGTAATQSPTLSPTQKSFATLVHEGIASGLSEGNALNAAFDQCKAAMSAPPTAAAPTTTPSKTNDPKTFQDLVKTLAVGQTSKSAAVAAAIDQRPDLYAEYLNSGGGHV